MFLSGASRGGSISLPFPASRSHAHPWAPGSLPSSLQPAEVGQASSCSYAAASDPPAALRDPGNYTGHRGDPARSPVAPDNDLPLYCHLQP